LSYPLLMSNISLPIVPPPSTTIPINLRFALSSEGDLRVVFLNGQPVMEFHTSDQAARDLVIMQLCEHGGLAEGQVAQALNVSRPTVSRAKRKYAEGGVEALLKKRGPKGPSKIKAYKKRLMIEMARAGRSKTEIASRLGVNESAVRKALRRLGLEELALRQPKLALEEPPQESAAEVAQAEAEPAHSAAGAEVEGRTCETRDVRNGGEGHRC
jgi:transposase